MPAAFRLSPASPPAISALDGTDAPEPAEGGWVLTAQEVTVEYPHAAERYFRHGWHSFSPCRWVDVTEPPAIVPVEELRVMTDDPVHALSERHGGSAVGAVESAAPGQVLLLGAIDLGARVEWDGARLTGAFEGRAGRWFISYGPEEIVLGDYVVMLGRRFGARKSPTPRTWMSWYSYYADIGEGLLDAARDGLAGLPFDCFSVDDGWQRAIGDWEANDRFPSGMDRFAARTREAGLVAGLWLAPFLAQRDAPVFQNHPDWFVHDAEGRPLVVAHHWGADQFAFDLTHPDALEHLHATIRRIASWGHGFLKLDFLFFGAWPGHRCDGTPRERALRQGLEALRDAAGDDVYLLACGAPILPSLGVFDAIRIGPDVAPWWETPLARHLHTSSDPSTRNAIATSLHRIWLRPVIDTDPDVVFFRSRWQLMSRGQQRALQDLAHICGVRATSDPPDWLDPLEREALDRFLREEPVVERLGRHRFRIDGREADFTAIP